ncbi:flavodoxin family protein, partial [Desulfovibrio sp. OttesenSCG-928-O18]|nr:flavodoxin family protein [Desulfovibrio sp. OttesenSCG-928-O18]
MGRNILVITGSPRKGGNTDTLVDAFIKGASHAGHTVSRFNAAATEIKGCRGCDKCWTTGTPCIFRDGFDTLAPMLAEADTLVLASPVYWFGFSTQLKSAVDKFYAMVRETCPTPLKIKDAILLLVAGDEDEAVF